MKIINLLKSLIIISGVGLSYIKYNLGNFYDFNFLLYFLVFLILVLLASIYFLNRKLNVLEENEKKNNYPLIKKAVNTIDLERKTIFRKAISREVIKIKFSFYLKKTVVFIRLLSKEIDKEFLRGLKYIGGLTKLLIYIGIFLVARYIAILFEKVNSFYSLLFLGTLLLIAVYFDKLKEDSKIKSLIRALIFVFSVIVVIILIISFFWIIVGFFRTLIDFLTNIFHFIYGLIL